MRDLVQLADGLYALRREYEAERGKHHTGRTRRELSTVTRQPDDRVWVWSPTGLVPIDQPPTAP